MFSSVRQRNINKQTNMKIRDKRKRGWLWVQNQIVDDWLPKIGTSGLALYFVLARFADQREQACFPSYETIASRMGVSRRTVIRTMKALVEHHLVEVEHRTRVSGGAASNIYYLIDPPCGQPDCGANDGASSANSPPAVTNWHQPSDTGDTGTGSVDKEINKTTTNKTVVVENLPQKTLTDAWQAARHSGTPTAQDQETAATIVQRHEQDGIVIVRALIGIVERKWPDCRRLSAAWDKYGSEAVEALRSIKMSAKSKENTMKLVEQIAAADTKAAAEREARKKVQPVYDSWPEALRQMVRSEVPAGLLFDQRILNRLVTKGTTCYIFRYLGSFPLRDDDERIAVLCLYHDLMWNQK